MYVMFFNDITITYIQFATTGHSAIHCARQISEEQERVTYPHISWKSYQAQLNLQEEKHEDAIIAR